MAGEGTGSIVAYLFVGDRLRNGQPVPADGEWLVHDGPVVLSDSGLHASRRPWGALQWAPGETLCLVELDGLVNELVEEDKLIARLRRIVRRADLTDDLWAFARTAALDVLHLWDAPDHVRRYLETGDETLRAVTWDSARNAALAAALNSARAAARATAWAAAGDAARAGARDASRDAARAIAWAVAEAGAGESAWNTALAAAEDGYGAWFDALCRSRLGVGEAA